MSTRIPARFPTSVQDWLNYTLLPIGDQQIKIVLRFAGRLDAGCLARAVRLTLDMEPVLGCRFVPRWYRPYWQRHPGLDDIELCSIVETDGVDEALLRFASTPGDPAHDVQVKAQLLRSDCDTLCIKIQHTAADGAGAKAYAYMLAQVYSRLCADPGWTPKPNLAGERGQAQVLRRLRLREKVHALRHVQSPRQSWGFPYTGRATSGRTFAVRHMDAEGLQRMRRLGHKHGASVNDVLTAVFYHALLAMVQPEPGLEVPVLITVDLRRYLPSHQAGAIGNLSGSLFVGLRYDPSATLEDVLVQIARSTAEAKRHYPGLGMALLMEAIAQAGFAVFRSRSNSLIRDALKTGHAYPTPTNLGVIDSEALRFAGVMPRAAWIMGTVPYPPAFLVAISTFQERLTLSAGYCAAATSPGLVEHLLDTMCTCV